MKKAADRLFFHLTFPTQQDHHSRQINRAKTFSLSFFIDSGTIYEDEQYFVVDEVGVSVSDEKFKIRWR